MKSKGSTVFKGMLMGVWVLSAVAQAANIAPQKNTKCKAVDFKGVHTLMATVDRVVDGDTVHIIYKEKDYPIRFLSMDTPETHYMGKSQGHWGDVAADRLGELLPEGTQVKLELDNEVCDQYGRLLAYVWKGNTLINLQMTADGFAVNYCIYPNMAHCKEIGQAAQKNVDSKAGFFADRSVEIPYDWRRRVSGRAQEKWVGNIDTHIVTAPETEDDVPVGQRVFFMKKADIKAPFHLKQ